MQAFKKKFGTPKLEQRPRSSPNRNTSKQTHGKSPQRSMQQQQQPPGRPRSNTDPQTRFEVFRSHWSQVQVIIDKQNNGSNVSSPGAKRPNLLEDVEIAEHNLDQMTSLLVEEEPEGLGQGPILEFILMEDIFEKILSWASRCGEYVDRLRLHQLRVYHKISVGSKQHILVHKPVIRPLLKLLRACSEHPDKSIEEHVVMLLHHLCICLTSNTELLELFFDASSEQGQGPSKFILFSLFVPYVHREGNVGQKAREALLYIMSFSTKNDSIGKYIADNSDFCPVLATGLSGLYSSLPQKIDIPSDDWHCLTQEDIDAMPDLVMFLNSLEFCNAVAQVAHPLVRDQLLSYIYNGFLVPVLGPALHQLYPYLPISYARKPALFSEFEQGDDFWSKSSVEEVLAATAYLELFLRRITEPYLMKTFLRFILTARHDDISILESLITRINSGFRLCMVSLSLFKTLVELNSEDVMFQLVFKYLIPCNHVMVSQRRSVRDLDIYGKTAEKFLSLKPSCCTGDDSDNSSLDEGSASSRSSSPEVSTSSPSKTVTPTPKSDINETGYLQYLSCARENINHCAAACACWTAPYDGETPSPDSVQLTEDGAPADSDESEQPASPEGGDTAKSEPVLVVNGTVAPEEAAQDTHANKDQKAEVVITQTAPVLIGESGEPSQSTETVACSTEQKTSPRTSGGESVISDTDSAISVGFTETPPIRGEADKLLDVPPQLVRSSSVELNAFIASLKKVEEPDNVCDNIDDSIHEMDEIIEQLTNGSFSSTGEAQHDIKSSRSVVQQPTGDIAVVTMVTSKDDAQVLDQGRNEAKVVDSGTDVTENEVKVTVGLAGESTEVLVNGDIAEAQEGETKARSSSWKDLASRDSVVSLSKVKIGKPDIGPFLSALMLRLESMVQNSLYVNLLLSGLISRLACFPQPLLRSFLLNHALVFQPTVKSLFQVLSGVKHKVDRFSYTVKDFEPLMQKAREFLAWRESQGMANGGWSSDKSPSPAPRNRSISSLIDQHRGKKRGSISDFLFRRNTPSPNQPRGRGQTRLQKTNDGAGYQYINRRKSSESVNNTDINEVIKIKNAIYCALLLEEFILELAALSQEHAVFVMEESVSSREQPSGGDGVH